MIITLCSLASFSTLPFNATTSAGMLRKMTTDRFSSQRKECDYKKDSVCRRVKIVNYIWLIRRNYAVFLTALLYFTANYRI